MSNPERGVDLISSLPFKSMGMIDTELELMLDDYEQQAQQPTSQTENDNGGDANG